MEKASDMELPSMTQASSRKPRKRVWPVLTLFVLAALGYVSIDLSFLSRPQNVHVPLHAADTLARCRALSLKPTPPPAFSNRTQSDRCEPGTKAVLIRNAYIWTGLKNGTDLLHADILLENGLIKSIGYAAPLNVTHTNYTEINAEGAWVTPGIIDVHSHIAVGSSPALSGANDANSMKGLTLPWLRSVDGLNTHDESYALSISGGVTTSLILPGSADAIGGQAFTIKLRETSERSTSSLLVDPPYGLNGTQVDYSVPPRWRHMKHACGENPSSSYSGTRMDTVWSYREAYEHARQIKQKQDEYCTKATASQWAGLGEFPEDLQWEALVDILRGKVKVHTHCYEAVDLDAFVRLSNEFKFPVAAFHHAHEAYLVPGVLKRAYEHPPAVAMFAAFARYKREAYRHSVFAPRILYEEGIKVIMKSDHPAIHSRWLLHEAQQAHYYGLPDNVALTSVTTNPAELLGLDYRLGYIKEGYDADLVIWDSHPLTLGATPVQVIIDGIPQLETPFVEKKYDRQAAPVTPNFDEETKNAIKFDGLPPLEMTAFTPGPVLFRNVSSLWQRDEEGVHSIFRARGSDDEEGVVFVEEGEIVCAGPIEECSYFIDIEEVKVIDLEGGSIAPALVSAGTSLGLQEIGLEPSTSDGAVFDPLQGNVPAVLGEGSITRAVDGLVFGTRDALIAYRSGVTTAVTSPISNGLLGGLGTYFSLGANHKLEHGAVLDDVTAVHVAVLHEGTASVSTQIAALRRLLLGPYIGERGAAFEAVAHGEVPLVVNVKNADIIASLLKLKEDVEEATEGLIRMTLVGAAEAHILAAELAAADVGVIVTPPRPFPYTWEGRRILEGPPVTEKSLVGTLFAHGVTVGIGPQGVNEMAQLSGWAARNLRWDAAWARFDSIDLIGEEDALDMVTTNIERLLGVTRGPWNSDLVATKGGDLLSFEGKVVAVSSPRRGVIDLFE